jgi:pectate lyase
MTFLQDLGVVEQVLQDVVAFAGGQPVSGTIGGYNASVVVLTGGPVAPYVTLSGSILSIILTVLGEYAAFSSGAPIEIAIKEGNTWYGVSLTKPVVAVAESLPAVA